VFLVLRLKFGLTSTSIVGRNAVLRSVPCCRNDTVRDGCDSTLCKSCKINVNRSIDRILGSVQLVRKNSTVFDMQVLLLFFI
jgi:hypothetical protein